MGEESFKEVTKGIQYVNIKPPVFQMQYYETKSGICFKGEVSRLILWRMECFFVVSPYRHLSIVISPLQRCTIAPFIHHTISQFHHED